MPRSLLKYLADIQLAIEDVEEYADGKNLSDYETDGLLQAGVERKFTIIGEAFAQMEHHYPGSRLRISEVRHIVAFRNCSFMITAKSFHQRYSISSAALW